MDYTQTLISFKEKNTGEADQVLPISVIPMLYQELMSAGMTIIEADGEFFKAALSTLFGSETVECKADIGNVILYWKHLLPMPVEEPKKEVEKEVERAPQASPSSLKPPKNDLSEAVFIDGIISTEHINYGDIPSEEDEGDPLYMPDSEFLDFKPEDLPDKKIDWDFAESVGAKRPVK